MLLLESYAIYRLADDKSVITKTEECILYIYIYSKKVPLFFDRCTVNFDNVKISFYQQMQHF
jgi:hypothetical protein